MGVFWDKVQKNWSLLKHRIQAEDIATILFENNVLTFPELEMISKGTTSEKKAINLLKCLHTKPVTIDVYGEFIKALQKDDTYSDVVEALESTPVTTNPKFVPKGDPSAIKDFVRDCLMKKYANQPGKTKLSDVIEILQKNVKCPGGYNWKKEQLIEFLPKIFTNVTIAAELQPSMGKKILYCHNLIPIELYQTNNAEDKDDTVPFVHENPTNSDIVIVTSNKNERIPTLQSSDCAKMSCYDPKELGAYLSKILEEKHIITDLPSIFEAEQITGEVFLTLTKSTISEICPSASFGVVTTLTLLIDKLHSEISSAPPNLEPGMNPSIKLETLRNFKCEVGISDNYIQGHLIDLKKSKTMMKLVPLQYFCLLQEADFEKEKELALQMLSSKLITFISACINNCQDGTIYFGINPDSGCIDGLAVKEDEILNSVNYYIDRAFPDESFKSIVHNTMRQPALIPIIDASHSKTDKFVVEIDVVADSIFIQNNCLITKLKELTCFPRAARKKLKNSYFSFDEHNEPILIRPDKQKEFFDQVNIASQARKKEEEMVHSPPHKDIRQQLLNNLTGGRPKLEDSIYPFIFLSAVDATINKDNVTKNLQFIKNLETDVVFDFDPKSSSQGNYHCYEKIQGELLTVLTLDNFIDPENNNESRKLIDSIDTNKVLWVFCNGYEPLSFEPRPPTEWNKNVRTAFQKALKHFTKNCPKNRILIIICLFSKDYETMLEGCEEIFTSFPNQWVVYAETEQIADTFKKEMIQRKKVDENDALHRFVIGMTWEQINNTIEQVTHQADTNRCILPQAAGTFTKPIPEKKLKSWCDVELLSSADPEVSEDINKKVMENFYKGESADWLNFWFVGQVLQRTHHQRLLDLVEKALTTEEENKVSTVILFHHPGSGATTSAKHVLWELRKKYRCCVIRKITEDTIDQLIDIRHFSEPAQSLKPVLILVDNEDEEKYRQLKLNLEMKCKKLNRESGKVFFTMLFCIRKPSLPLTVLPHQMLLQQKLTEQEQKLFGEKHKQLTSEFEKNKENIDPKYLISFNILKNNFNHDYILKVIKEFVADVKDERERSLLSFIALLNKYDPQFRSIPVSCFDALFKKESEINNQAYKRSTNWEANLNQAEAVQVLLNISPIKKTRTRSTRISLRVHHRLVADSLLEFLITDKNSLSDLMLSLVNKIIIFDSETKDFMHLQNIVRDIMIKREFNQVDGKKEMFSPFITQVNKSSGDECSIQIFCDFFDRNHDPFIAQQISRFYIILKNWYRAEIYAQKATELKPKCSILWDTFGQVYKAQLIEELENFKKNTDKTKKYDNNFVQKLIALAQKAIFYFKQVQRINEEKPSDINENNVAGYFGELKTQIMFLHLLKNCQCFQDHNHLMQCLMSKNFSEKCFNFLQDDEKKFLCQLEDNSMKTLRVLDEQYLHVREEAQFDVAVYSGTFGRELQNLISLMYKFHEYFGAPIDDSYITKLPEPQASMHRWRIALKLGAMSLNFLLRLRAQNLETKRQSEENSFCRNLITIYDLMLPNVNSERCSFDYLLAILNAVTLLVVDRLAVNKCKKLSYPKVLDFSKKLLESKQPNEKRPFVEPYMYFVMFNFPSATRNSSKLCTIAKLQEACDKWRAAYDQKFKDAEARTLFYLAKGELLMDLVHSDTFPMKGRDNWENPQMRDHLALYAGAVESGGNRVKVKITQDGNTRYLTIPTSYTVKKTLWQKETYFFIGFSFSGPKAYGIPQDPPLTHTKLKQDVLMDTEN